MNQAPISSESASEAQGQPQPPRITVVRSQGLRQRVGAAISAAGVQASIHTSPSYLSVLGALVNEQCDVIIGPISAMTGMIASTGRALRRLAPHARLVVVAEPTQRAEAEAALSAGFDDCVYEPAQATRLLGALGIDTQTRKSHPAERTIAALPAEPPTDLGDVDLVEAILCGERDLRQVAVRLLAQQSGVKGIALADSADQVSPDNAVVAVHFAGENLGLLHAPPPANPAQLTPWSAWLARWLALEHKTVALERQAMTDHLTGIWNRRYFQQFLDGKLQHAADQRQQVTLLLFDIDNFKKYNDKYGHPAGDEILRETAKLISSVIRDHDIVARIGGDEFAVVFWDKDEPRHLGSQHPDDVIAIAKRFQKAICEHRFPKLGAEAVGQLTVSGGLASFPWDGRDADELIARADAMAITSKRQGKNVISFGPGSAPNGGGRD